MDTGCGGVYVFNFTNATTGESASPGECLVGYACNQDTFRCEVSISPPSEQIRKCLTHDVVEMQTHLQKFWSFHSGTSGTSISDGGGDMYDGGNKLRIRAGGAWSSDLRYNQKCTGDWKATGKADVVYFSCKITSPVTIWFAMFKSDSGAIDGFKVDGNLGADGGGSVMGSKTDQWPNGALWGYYKQVYGTNDPSVNHLVLVPSESWTNSYPTNSDKDTQEVLAPSDGSGVDMLMYVMWGGRNSATGGVQYTSADFNNMMKSIGVDC